LRTFIFTPLAARLDRRLEQDSDILDLLSLKSSSQACRLAISRVVETMTVSMIRRLLARNEVPVSVSSTIASTRRAFTRSRPN
jgi:hypothetical protein